MATGSLHTAHALGRRTVEDCLHSFPGTPPATHNAATSWWKTASDSPFIHGVVSASSVYGTWWHAQVCPWDRWPGRCCPLGTRGTRQACLLPRLLPQIGARAPALVVPSCLLKEQPGFLLYAQGAGDTCLATGLLFLPRQAILLPERFPNPSPTAPSLPRRRCAAPSPHLLRGSAVNRRVRPCLSQAEGMLGQRVFRSMRVFSTMPRRLAQASSSIIPKPNCDFPTNAVLSQGSCTSKEVFAVCGCLPRRDWAQVSSSSLPNISQ